MSVRSIVLSGSGRFVPGADYDKRFYDRDKFIKVIHTGSLFVAVTESADVYTSPDGATWSAPVRLASNKRAYSAASNGSVLLVLTGDSPGPANPLAYRSTDNGVTWTSQFMSTTDVLYDIVWVSWLNLFIAGGVLGRIVTSPDGVAWTAYSGGMSDIYAVIASTGRVVAVGLSGRATSSTDGVTWTSQTSMNGSGPALTYLAWSPASGGRFMAIESSGSGRIYTSATGLAGSWTLRSTLLFGLTSALSVSSFYSFLLATDEIVSTTDGVSATQRYVLRDHPIRSMCESSGGVTVAVGDNGYIVSFSSPTLSAGVRRNEGPVLDIYSIGASPTLAVVGAGIDGTSSADETYTTPDFITFTKQTIGSGTTLKSILWNGSQFVAAGRGGSSGLFLTSPNGVSWTTHISAVHLFYGVAYASSIPQYVVAADSQRIYTSSTGLSGSWTSSLIAGANTFLDVVWSGSQFVAVGTVGTIFTSATGGSWTSRTSGTSANLRSVAWSSSLGLFVVVGDSGVIRTSSDGITWTARTSGVVSSLQSVTWALNQFIAVSSAGNTILTSTDGTTWVVRPSSSIKGLRQVRAAFGSVVAVGDAGQIVATPPPTKISI